MAAPTLQAQGATSAATTGSVSPTIPTHQADDILVVDVVLWAPNTAISFTDIPLPAGWSLLTNPRINYSGSPADGQRVIFWRRATGAGHTITVTHSNDTGSDTCFGARAYVVRGCITTGNPWDEVDPTGILTAANGSCDAVTVSGTERMVVQFGAATDNLAFAMTSSGWTTGTEDNDATGTDCVFQTARKDNVSADTAAAAMTVSAPAQGGYAFVGVSFKPPSNAVTGTGAPSIDEAILDGTGWAAATGTGAPAMDEISLAASGAETMSGAAAVAVDEAVLGGAGAETFTGTGAVAADEAILAASGAETMSGTGAIAIDEAILDGVGEMESSDVTGTGAVSVDEAALAASGEETITGTSAVAAEEAALAASGAETITGSSAIAIDEAVLAGTGFEITGTAAIAAEEAVLAGDGLQTENVTGTGDIVIDEARLAGEGIGGIVKGDDGGRGPLGRRTPFDDWTIQMDDDAIVELYVLRKTR